MPDEPNLTVYLWSEEAGKWNDPVVVEAPRRVFTARSLHDALGKLIETHHHLADLPVHLLDMESESDYPYGGLLTDIETDIFDVDQGMVLALGSWPSKDHARAAADLPVQGEPQGATRAVSATGGAPGVSETHTDPTVTAMEETK